MAMQKTPLDAKLEVLLGERGQSADRAVRHKEIAALRDQMATQISKAVLASIRAEIAEAKRIAQEALDAQVGRGDALVPDEANQDILDAQDEAAAAAQQASAPIVPSQITSVMEEASYAAGLVPPLVVNTLPTTGNFAGRLAFLTTDGKLYRYNGGWTKAVDGGDLIANSILAGAFQAGAVRAEDVAADAILARHIGVGDFTNLVPDGDLRDIGGWGFTAPGYFTLNAPSQAATVQNSYGELVFTPIAGSGVAWVRARSKRFPLKAGDSIRASFQGWPAGIGSFRFQARVNFYNRAGAEITSSIIATRTDADPVLTTPFAINVTVPAGTVAGAFDFIADNSVTTVPIRFAAPMVRLRNGGELTVDGSIKANHLDTENAVITGTAQIGALVVDTINISGNAVSVLRRATGAGEALSASAWRTIASLTFVPYGVDFAVWLSATVAGYGGTSGGNNISFRIAWRGAIQNTREDIFELPAAKTAKGFVADLTTIAAGGTSSGTFVLQAKMLTSANGATGYMGDATIVIAEFKK